MISKINIYEIGKPIDTSALEEYSKEEFARSFGISTSALPGFVGEKVYHDKNIIFLDLNWAFWAYTKGDKIVSMDAIRKASSKEEVDFLFKKLLQYCKDKMGKYTKKSFFNDGFMWEWTDICVNINKTKNSSGSVDVGIGIGWNKSSK